MTEFRCELIPLTPGMGGDTERILNVWAREGWQVVSCFPQPVRTNSMLDVNGPDVRMGLLVILSREVTSLPAAARLHGIDVTEGDTR